MKHLASIQAEFLKYADDLSGKIHEEREKRLTLLELPPEVKDVQPATIKQGKLREVRLSDGKMDSYARVRMKQEAGKAPKYSLGVKNFPLHQEVEAEISKEMFESFFPDNVMGPQTKLRYSLPSGWDVDVVEGTNEIYAECEHSKNENITAPDHWKIK